MFYLAAGLMIVMVLSGAIYFFAANLMMDETVLKTRDQLEMSGASADMIKKAISLGVSKINVNTECQLSFAAATREYIEAGKDQKGKGFDPRKLLAPGAEAIKATVKEKMELFGSVGKA